MSALRLVLRGEPDQRLDLRALTPNRLAGLNPASIAALPVQTTRKPARVGDWFAIQAGDAMHIVIEGGSRRLDHIGAGMTGGVLEISGDVGQCAGRLMAGGRLVIGGQAGDFVASGLRGGMVKVGGDAGAYLGGARAGERAGMRGGIVIVAGGAGAQAGERLRRGVIIVEGDAGDHAGSCMVAGTLILCRAASLAPGCLMRRGTIVLGAPADLLPGFVASPASQHVFLTLLARAVSDTSVKAAAAVRAASVRWVGDAAILGKGEVFSPTA